MVVVSPQHVPKIEEIRGACPSLQHCVVVNDAEAPGPVRGALDQLALPGWSE